jgi:hypothetical protein
VSHLSTSLLVLFLLACRPDATEDDTAKTPDTTGSSAVLISDLTLEQSTLVPTVATVRWHTDTPLSGRLLVTVEGEPVREIAGSEGPQTDHEITLIGIPEGMTAAVVVEVFDSETTTTSEALTFEAGLLDPAIPRPVLSTAEPLTDSGFILTPIFSDSASWITLLDPSGRMVWAMKDVDQAGHRARLLPDGTGVAWLWFGIGNQDSGVQAVSFDGSPLWRTSGKKLHQDFDLLDSETALILGWEVVEQETDDGPITLLSDRIVKLNASGTTEEVWRLLDAIPYAPDPEQQPSEQVPEALDWAHVNYMAVHGDTLYLTALIIDAVMILDLDTLDLDTLIVGGEPEDGMLFDGPHSAWPVEDGLVVFNHRGLNPDACSEVLTLPLDQTKPTRGETLAIEDCYHISYLGNAQPLSGGDVMVDWSNAGVLSVFSSDGVEQAALRMSLGGTFGYAEWVPTLGEPFSP